MNQPRPSVALGYDGRPAPPVVAAIVAVLAAAVEQPTEERRAAWRASGQVAPGWRETAAGAWRERERLRGWRA